MQTGVILELSPSGEYGKIGIGKGEAAHFHGQCLWGVKFSDLVKGQDVEFEIQPTYNGYLAFHIRPCLNKKESRTEIITAAGKAEPEGF